MIGDRRDMRGDYKGISGCAEFMVYLHAKPKSNQDCGMSNITSPCTFLRTVCIEVLFFSFSPPEYPAAS